MICCKGKEYSGRAKVSSLKKGIRRVANPQPYKLIDFLSEGNYDINEDDWDMVENILLNHQLLFRARGYANKDIMNRL